MTRTDAGPLRRAARTVRRMIGLEPVYVEKPRPPFALGTGSVQPHELELVRRAVEKANAFDGPIVEIGALFGLTTTKLARWKADGKKLLAVDNFGWNPLGLTPAEHQTLTAAVLGYLIDRGDVEIRVSGKDEFFASYAGAPPALAFLDAIHTYEETAKDIAAARKVGARLIAGHDYSLEFPGVMRAVDEAGGPRERVGTVWVLADNWE